MRGIGKGCRIGLRWGLLLGVLDALGLLAGAVLLSSWGAPAGTTAPLLWYGAVLLAAGLLGAAAVRL